MHANRLNLCAWMGCCPAASISPAAHLLPACLHERSSSEIQLPAFENLRNVRGWRGCAPAWPELPELCHSAPPGKGGWGRELATGEGGFIVECAARVLLLAMLGSPLLPPAAAPSPPCCRPLLAGGTRGGRVDGPPPAHAAALVQACSSWGSWPVLVLECATCCTLLALL